MPECAVRRLLPLAIMSCMLALDLYSGRLNAGNAWDWLYVIVDAAYVLACLSVAVRAKAGAEAVILVATLCVMVPSVESSRMVFGVAAAFGIVFLLAPMWEALGLLAANTAANLLAPVMMGVEIRPAVAVFIIQCIGVAVGYGIRRYRAYGEWQKDLLRIRILSERNAMLEHNMLISRQLHDTLTNDLTYVITIVNTRILDADGTEREILKQVDGKTRDALHCAHAVIDQLRADGLATPDTRDRSDGMTTTAMSSGNACVDGSSDSRSLIDLISRHRDELSTLGYQGTVSVEGTRCIAKYDPEVRDEIRSLLVELFANIRRHCVPGDDYSLALNIDDRQISIVQMNTVAHESSEPRNPRHVPSGRGLAMHRGIVRRLGGTVYTSLENGVWTMRVQLPCTARS